MVKNISVGIDIGSSSTKVVIGEFTKGETIPRIIGVGESQTNGIRHGHIISSEEVVESIKKAVGIAEKTSGIKITKAILGISGISLKGETGTGIAIISKADGEVTNLDIQKALDESENNISTNNKRILQAIPISYKLDGKEIIGRVDGLFGNKLEIKTLFITCSKQHLEDMIDALAEAKIETIDAVPLILSSSEITLSKKQKIVGSALVDIGSETLSLAIFENDVMISLQTFSIGSSDITNDIALGLKTTLEEAEMVKIGNLAEKYPKKKVDEIIEARLGDIFELISNHLKKIKRNELLPAGIFWIGGGASIKNLDELSKKALSLPSKTGSTEIFGNIRTKLKEPQWLPVVSLLFNKTKNYYSLPKENNFSNLFQNLKKGIKSTLKQLLP